MENFTTPDGANIALTIQQGDKKTTPIVLLHGWSSSAIAWAPVIERMTEHTIYAWNARIHTESTTIEKMAQDLRELLTHYDINPIVVGHSMGTLTVLEYIRQFGTDMLEKFVIIDQSPKLITDETWDKGIYGNFTDQDSEKLIRLMEDDFIETVIKMTCLGDNRLFRKLFLFDAPILNDIRDRLHALSAKTFIDTWKTFVTKDYRDVLPKIDIPVLAVMGGQSNFYPPSLSDYLKQEISDIRLETYDNGSHSPQFEFPDQFAEDLTLFSR